MEDKSTLVSERVTFTPLRREDFEEILAMYDEPDTAKYILPLQNKDQAFYLNFLEGKIASNKSLVGFWTVRNSADNTFIGTANLNKFQHRDITHVGCHLSREFWGQGFGFEVMNFLKNYGVEQRGMPEVYGLVQEGHNASKHLMMKMGFKLIEQIHLEVPLNIFRFRQD